MYYLYKDHLGSITAITNQSGAVVERRSFDAWGRLRNPSNWTFNNIPAMTILDRGYTGHEHLGDFGLINMNGRMYDPLIGQMLSPDPYVQDIAGSQGFNRYSYCLNNPLKYTDPSGENPLLLIGIAVGVAVNLAVNASKIHNGMDFYAYAFTGAFTGALGGIFGAGVGVAQGAMLGAASGFSAGFVAGAGNAWIAGEDVRTSLRKGLQGGLMGGAMGAIGGGISGHLRNRDIVIDTEADSPSPENQITVGEGMEYSYEYTKKFSDNYHNVDIKNMKLHVDGTIPNKNYTQKGDLIFNKKGKEVWGTSIYRQKTGITDVYLHKAAYVSMERLYLIMGHEYLHASYFSAGLFNLSAAHAGIYDWQVLQAQLWKCPPGVDQIAYDAYRMFYDLKYAYDKFGFFVINMKPWLR